MSDKLSRDPFPNLPRRGLFADEAPAKRVAKSPAMRSIHEVAQDLRSVGVITASEMAEFDADCLKPAKKKAAAGVAKGGRPTKGKPWEALGLNERTYRRRKKAGTL